MNTQMVNFSIPNTLLQNIDIVARKTSRSRSEIIREAIRRLVEEQEEKEILFKTISESGKRNSLSENKAIELVEEAKKWARKKIK